MAHFLKWTQQIIWDALGECSEYFDELEPIKINVDDDYYDYECDFDCRIIHNRTSVYCDYPTTLTYFSARGLQDSCGDDMDSLIKATRKMANNIISECKKNDISITTRGRIDDGETLHIYFKDYPIDNNDESSKWPGIRFVGDGFKNGVIGIGINSFFYCDNQ